MSASKSGTAVEGYPEFHTWGIEPLARVIPYLTDTPRLQYEAGHVWVLFLEGLGSTPWTRVAHLFLRGVKRTFG